jgi:hypothetical protein
LIVEHFSGEMCFQCRGETDGANEKLAEIIASGEEEEALFGAGERNRQIGGESAGIDGPGLSVEAGG